MKITKVQVLHPRKGFVDMVGVRIYADNGLYGDGEVAGVSAGHSAFGMIRDIAHMVIGRDPLDNEAIWDDIYKESMFGQNGGQTFYSALGAIDMAIWDLRCKSLDLPLYKLLGGKKRDKLRSYASQMQATWFMNDIMKEKGFGAIFGATPEDYARNCREVVDLGYDAVKVDFGQMDPNGRPIRISNRAQMYTPPALDVIESRCAAVREAVGPNVDIMVENHSFTDAQTAVQIGRALEKYNIFFFEEPSAPTPKTTKYIHDHVNIPIAHGEHIIGRWDYMPYFENGSVQVIQPDIGNCGGITEVKKICDIAYIYDVEVQIHVFGSHLMTPAAAHLESVIPNFCIHEHHMNTQMDDWRALTVRTYDPVDGYLEAPDLPGIGNEWSEYALNCEDQITLDETGWHR